MKNAGLFSAWVLGIALSAILIMPHDGNVSALEPGQQGSLQKERVIEEKVLPNVSGVSPSPVGIVELANENTTFRRIQTENAQHGINSVYSSVLGEDWLKGLKIKITNASDKVITYAAFSLCVSDSSLERQKEDLCTLLAAFGQFYPMTKGSPTIWINPGDVVSASISDANLDSLKRRAETVGVFSLERLVVAVGQVLFEDMTLWKKGYFHRQHPNDPNTWVRIGMEDIYEKELELRKKKSKGNDANNKIGHQRLSPYTSLTDIILPTAFF
jgi:hypothetical protein